MRTKHLLVLASILVFASCPEPFVPNPHLRLLRSDGFSILHPAVAPNGTEVFYLSGNTLWKLRIGSDSASLVRAGWFQSIALSRDGARLALLGRDLQVVDNSGALLQTLVPAESTGGDPIDVQFNRHGSHVYYSVSSGPRDVDYYRVALDGTGRELVRHSSGSVEAPPMGANGFALTDEDSILDYRTERAWPEISPTDDSIMAYSSNWWFHGDIHLAELSTDSGFRLDCYPYSDSRVACLSWFPDGRKLAFCASDNGLGEHYELWMLDSVEY